MSVIPATMALRSTLCGHSGISNRLPPARHAKRVGKGTRQNQDRHAIRHDLAATELTCAFVFPVVGGSASEQIYVLAERLAESFNRLLAADP